MPNLFDIAIRIWTKPVSWRGGEWFKLWVSKTFTSKYNFWTLSLILRSYECTNSVCMFVFIKDIFLVNWYWNFKFLGLLYKLSVHLPPLHVIVFFQHKLLAMAIAQVERGSNSWVRRMFASLFPSSLSSASLRTDI